MCLSLIVSTLHQPCQPPTNDIHISPVVTDHAERVFSFPLYTELRDVVGSRVQDATVALPSLADLCADVLAKHDHSARRLPNLAPSVTRLVERQTMYYQIPVVDDNMRKAKRRVMKAKKVYLANTTLVVVPQILVQQWRDEIEKHVRPGAVNVLEITKDPLPDIEVLLRYDVSYRLSLPNLVTDDRSADHSDGPRT